MFTCFLCIAAAAAAAVGDDDDVVTVNDQRYSVFERNL